MRVNGNKSFENDRCGRLGVNQIHRSVVLAVTVLFIAISSRATSWYVDNAVSGGSKNGTSWANAWSSIGSIAWTSIKPGDALYISGGSSSQVYAEYFDSSSVSGTASSRITISVGQDAGHNGQVIIDGAATGQPYGMLLGSYQHITGNVSGQTNLVVRNVLNSQNGMFNGSGIYAQNAVGLVIDGVCVHTCNNGMTFWAPTPITISNCFLYDIQGDHGILLDLSTGNYDANIVHNCTLALNGYMNGSPYGPDGIQGSDGVSVYNCNIYMALGTVNTGGFVQHMDAVQFIGNHIKIYNNTMTDMGNSCVQGECSSTAAGYIMVYNNVMQVVSATENVQRGVEWGPNTQCTSLTDVYICNNTVVDMYGYYAIHWVWSENGYNVTPSISNFVVENNIYYNSMPPFIDSESGASASSITVDYNSTYAGTHGGTTFSIFGTSPSQPHAHNGNVQFVSYTPNTAGNNLQLKSTDTVAMNNGISLANLFTTDKLGVSRPQGAAWDIGAYEYASGGGSTNPVISVTPATLNFGTLVTGSNATQTFTVQNTGGGTLAGSASVASPYSILSGGSYSLTNGQSQVVTVLYSPTGTGTNTQNVTFTGGGGATASATGVATAPLTGLSFPASAAVITSPFALGSDYISQPMQTGVTNGGTATFTFNITNAGNYVVQCLVQATNEGMASFYVNMDAMPTDPYMVWKILPLTTGFQEMIVNWQGNGAWNAPQFAPQIFNLTAGAHRLIFVGREVNTALQQVSILKIPSPPTGLHVVPGS